MTDDGRGGAGVTPGHGLEGIEERLTGLGGRLDLRSPVGGPTHVRVHVPVPYAAEDTVDEGITPEPEPMAPEPEPIAPEPEPIGEITAPAPTFEFTPDQMPTEELRPGTSTPHSPRLRG